MGGKKIAYAGAQFRDLMAKDEIIVMPGCYDPLSAQIIEQAGFPAAFMTGGGVSRSYCFPDVGLLTMVEMVTTLRNIVNAVTIPVIADADTGYGNAINVIRAVREFEATGAAGLFIEDQETPKKCGKYPGIQLLPLTEMVKKIKGALRARRDPDFILIARIMQTRLEGKDGMIARGKAYAEAGADVIMVRGMKTVEEHQRAAKAFGVPVMLTFPQLQTPALETSNIPGIHTVKDLEKMGFKAVIFASVPQRAAIKGMKEVLSCLKRDGGTEGCKNLMVTFKDREEIIGLGNIQDLERELVDAGR
jgi:2,3-dimethylmalate lyase